MPRSFIELLQAQKHVRGRILDRILEQLSDADRKSLEAALQDTAVPASHIAAALRDMGFVISNTAVRDYRGSIR